MSPQKHLLVLHQAYVIGGAELTTRNVLDGLQQTGDYRVTLICPQVMSDYWAQGCDQWLDSAPLGLAGWFDTPTRLWRDARVLSTLLREHQVDLAIGMMHYSSAVLALAIRMAGVATRLLASYRGPVFEHLRHFEPNRGRRIWIHAAICASSHAAQGVTMPSEGTALELSRHCWTPARKLHVVYNGINLEEAGQRGAQPIKLPTPLEQGEPFAAVSARLSEEKRLDWVINAFARLDSAAELKLLVLGEGSARAQLENRVHILGLEQRIIFQGHVDDPLPYLARSRMFIHTCQYEGFGYSILEALACGTPVIATDCPYGPRELLHDPGSPGAPAGLLVPMNDPDALAAAMSLIWKDETLAHALIERGRARAQELSLPRMQTGHEQVIRDLLGKN